jgi:hypothetical protein
LVIGTRFRLLIHFECFDSSGHTLLATWACTFYVLGWGAFHSLGAAVTDAQVILGLPLAFIAITALLLLEVHTFATILGRLLSRPRLLLKEHPGAG